MARPDSVTDTGPGGTQPPWLADSTLKALLETLPEGVGLTVDGVIRYCNPAISHLLGHRQEAFVNTSPLDWLHPGDRERARNNIADVYRTGASEPSVYRLRHGDGTYIPVEILSRTTELDGQVALVSVFRDVRDRVRTEEQHQLLFTAVDQSAEMVMISDTEGAILYVNPAFERVTGYASDEVLGENPRILRHGDQDREVYADLWDTLKAGESWSGRIVNRRKDGEPYVLEAVISPVRDTSDDLAYFVSVGRDVSSVVELESQLRQAQKMETIGQITAGVAHDFNNLLTVIGANAELVEAGLPPGQGDLSDLLGDLRESTRSGAELVRQLMMFSRRRSLHMEPVDLLTFLEKMILVLGRLLPERIEVRSEVGESVPPVLADPGSLEQMLISLATNARDAMPDGGTLKLGLEVVELGDDDGVPFRWGGPGSYVGVVVADDGDGMFEEEAARAFEPMFTTKPPGVGTGLGLSVVYGLMRSHGGALQLASDRGLGTRVELYFPVADEAVDTTKAADEALPTGSETVLLVEDSDPVRRVARKSLERLGYRVLVARHGAEALTLLEEAGGEVDLVLSDMVMPVMGGEELRRRAQKQGWSGPFLMTSGYSQHEMTLTRSEDGPNFLPKPWTTRALADAVRWALEGHE